MCRHYAVEVVEDDELPPSREWALADTAAGPVLFVKQQACTLPRVYEEAASAFDALMRRFPRQRAS